MRAFLTSFVVLISCVISEIHSQQIIDSQCVVQTSGFPGTCTLLIQCEKVRQDLIKRQKLPQVCGFQGTQSIVCCPNVNTSSELSINKRKCREYSKYARDENGETCKRRTKRVIGGSKSKRGEFPHMAALSFDDISESQTWQCGGIIISELFILTGATCASAPSLGPVKYVLVGVTNLNDTDHRQIIKVDKITKHPAYVETGSEHDIALLELEKPIELNSYARPACLYTNSELEVDEAIVTGWGSTEEAGSPANDLHKATLSFVDTKSCNETYKVAINPKKLPNGIRKDIHVCAKGKNGEDACVGDSGGPLQIEHTNDDIECMYDIVGITSFGIGCGRFAGVYTKVSFYVDWIETIVWGQNL